MDHKVSARPCGLGVAGFSLVESIGLGKQKVRDTVQEVEELPVCWIPVVHGHLSTGVCLWSPGLIFEI